MPLTTSRPDDEPPLSLLDVLEAEHRQMRGIATPVAGAAPETTVGAEARQRAHIAERHRNAYAALCLSGGGIRSASFALGVIQGLARHDLLRGFDYLSTVSGGGYTGGWLTGWLHQATRDPEVPSPFDELRRDPCADGPPEPEPVASFRACSRFMSPATGFLSADVWTLVAIVARNLFLNWLVLLPLVAAGLLLPVIYFGVVQDLYQPLAIGATDRLGDPASIIFSVSAALLLGGTLFALLNLPSYGDRQSGPHKVLLFNLLPFCASLIGLTVLVAASRAGGNRVIDLVLLGALMHGALWTLAGPLSGQRRWRPQTILAGVISGAVAMAGLTWLAVLLKGAACRPIYVTTAFPLFVAVLMAGAFVFMGVAGSDMDDADLEWWSRSVAWFLMVGVVWLLIGLVVFQGPVLLRMIRGVLRDVLGLTPGHAAAAIPVITSVLGAAAAVLGRSIGRVGEGRAPVGRRLAFGLAAPAFAVLLLSSLSWLNEWAIARIHGGFASAGLSAVAACGSDSILREASLLAAVYLVFGMLMGVFVPVNKFSLHGMYRNRLIRSFLGASRPGRRRHPNPFTGFDPADDVSLAELKVIARPFLVVNMTLDKIAQAAHGRLHRKAESFTATPLHVGSASDGLGYRPADEYAAARRAGGGGLSLGTAITISGAAASPNMGAFSTPALTFLLTLFNARLGIWLGNPGTAGRRTWRSTEPRLDAAPILREMLGLTTDRSPYVYLSDGGHFENLGLYQMVLRRCRYVLVSDASCDPSYTFDDLATAIRQIRIDLGIPIVFDDGCPIDAAHQGNGNPHAAAARILYREVDGPEAEDGVLIYLKATLCGREPIDVINYGKSHPAFPHESTANQWFDEAQFESYRMLGLHSVHEMAASYAVDGDLSAFFRRWSRSAAVQA
ncbi:MAG TPA: hypothetical protein VIC33_08940 [Vicinamibacterales bacterium]